MLNYILLTARSIGQERHHVTAKKSAHFNRLNRNRPENTDFELMLMPWFLTIQETVQMLQDPGISTTYPQSRNSP
jgi:hypothetical protein